MPFCVAVSFLLFDDIWFSFVCLLCFAAENENDIPLKIQKIFVFVSFFFCVYKSLLFLGALDRLNFQSHSKTNTYRVNVVYLLLYWVNFIDFLQNVIVESIISNSFTPVVCKTDYKKKQRKDIFIVSNLNTKHFFSNR